MKKYIFWSRTTGQEVLLHTGAERQVIFWSKTTGQEVWTEIKAESVKAVRQWAKANGVTITSPISVKK